MLLPYIHNFLLLLINYKTIKSIWRLPMVSWHLHRFVFHFVHSIEVPFFLHDRIRFYWTFDFDRCINSISYYFIEWTEPIERFRLCCGIWSCRSLQIWMKNITLEKLPFQAHIFNFLTLFVKLEVLRRFCAYGTHFDSSFVFLHRFPYCFVVVVVLFESWPQISLINLWLF